MISVDVSGDHPTKANLNINKPTSHQVRFLEIPVGILI